MKFLKFGVMAASLMAGPAFAQGDAAAGEAAFRQCVACHVVTSPSGETLAGRAGRSGPNLYGITDQVAGSVDGFRYSSGLAALNGAGVVWTEDNFAAYVQDPAGFVREATGDGAARSSMSFRVRNDTDARNLFAFLAQFAP